MFSNCDLCHLDGSGEPPRVTYIYYLA